MKKRISLCLLTSALMACQSPPQSSLATRQLTQQSTPQTQAVTRAQYRYSADKSELLLILERDTGDILEMTTRRMGSSVSTETVTKKNGALVSRRNTLSSEADLAIKVAANNGWQDVYTDLKSRYTAAGLI